MTTEAMIMKALGEYEGRRDQIRREYEFMFNAAGVNAAGETYADDILAINKWAELEQKAAKAQLREAMKQIEAAANAKGER